MVDAADATAQARHEESLRRHGAVECGREHGGLEVGQHTVVECPGLGDDLEGAVQADDTRPESLAQDAMPTRSKGELEAARHLDHPDPGGAGDLLRDDLLGGQRDG